MARSVVTGDQYQEIDGRMMEIKRQLRQKGGSPLDPERVKHILQLLVEGKFSFDDPHVIDCDAAIPRFLIAGFERCEEDQVGSRIRGTITVDPADPFHTFLTREQAFRIVDGTYVLRELRRLAVPVYGIAALDQMRRLGLIPDRLKGQKLFAWGDVLRNLDKLLVRYLHWCEDEWKWSGFGHWFFGRWDAEQLAVVRAH